MILSWRINNFLPIFLLLIFFNNIHYSLCIIETGKYSYIKRIKNGNYIILSSTKIIFADSTLTSVIKVKNFDNEIYSSDEEIGSTSVAQFNLEDNGYIIAILNNKLFIFSYDGDYLSETEISFIYPKYSCPIIPISHSGNNYYFTLIYPNCENRAEIMFKKVTFDSTLNTTNFSETISYQYFNENGFYPSISCELMINNNQDYIACFFGKEGLSVIAIFNINDYQIYKYKTTNDIKGQYYKSAIFPDKMEQGLFCLYSASSGISCLKYDITENEITVKNTSFINGCSTSSTSLFVEYFYETENFIVGCLGYNKEFYLSQFSKDLNFIKIYDTKDIIPSSIGAIKRINIILPSGQNKYNVFTTAISSNVIKSFQNEIDIDINITNIYPTQNLSTFICNYYYSYDHKSCIETIPEGYYLNSTEDKTIDKCHDNCKTCKEGPTNINNNCLLCKDIGNIYFDLGNCVEVCENGIFTDIDSIKKCKCRYDIKCKYCTEESIAQNLCVSCNINDSYYPKSDDEENIDGYINCYKNPEGYYLKNDVYEPCYLSCKACIESGNKLDNKCEKCKNGYEIKNDYENDYICYEICPFYYYYDENNTYHCTEDGNCPSLFNKLIIAKHRCIDDCTKDNIYQFEYNNECIINNISQNYINNDTEYQSTNVLNCENKNQYYNYEKTECIDTIPDGYYCDNENLRTIDKCHDNCETCNQGPTKENNNCLKCPEYGPIYFDLGNCKEKCINGFFIDNSIKKCKCSTNITCNYCSIESKKYNLCESCNIELGYYPLKDDPNNKESFINCYNNTTISDGFYLNIESNQYESCYSSCEKCDELGDENDNKCIKCKSSYYFIDEYNNNCYLKCPYYYYFDSNNKYHCIDSNKCPEKYNKLIKSKKRCVNNCSIDNLYKYEYNGICYDNCPNGTIPLYNNVCESSKKNICSEDYPYLIIETNNCSKNCNIEDWLYGNCITIFLTEKIKQDNIIKIINSITSHSIDPLLDNVIKKNGEDIIIEEKQIKYLITTSSNQKNKKYNDISTIILGECETKLKTYYNISEYESLLIFKVDINLEGLLSPLVIYE